VWLSSRVIDVVPLARLREELAVIIGANARLSSIKKSRTKRLLLLRGYLE